MNRFENRVADMPTLIAVPILVVMFGTPAVIVGACVGLWIAGTW